MTAFIVAPDLFATFTTSVTPDASAFMATPSSAPATDKPVPSRRSVTVLPFCVGSETARWIFLLPSLNMVKDTGASLVSFVIPLSSGTVLSPADQKLYPDTPDLVSAAACSCFVFERILIPLLSAYAAISSLVLPGNSTYS